ncbi:MAG TPA: serine/threonine-protein kinase, partial [Pyrinomonadaceae bacterium]|nr:serine/threonine-protein kinase [Pyrinomonadaceae bacterium]
MRCPSCASEIPEGKGSCPSCGAGLDSSFAPTRVLEDSPRPARGEDERAARPSSRPPLPAQDSLDSGRFPPGTTLAGRYRVVSLLGRGGMGEVYRADDLKLEQPVALKFLPESLSKDGAALARLYREVRVARQVSHRNVCRVYDIGETEGLHFISMEYVRGEELSSLLRRIGRLPADKAVEVARQLCAGLAAAHEAGVLHRDLKPANVMLDERGNVRVTDFGLALLAEELRGTEAVAGTPAYMAPEQLAGREVTARSDIYALGLVIYEIFTGKRAFEARSIQELLRLRETASTPTSPSSLVKDLDPLVERVIKRCLEIDPARRPASALQVAAALPGGDPIAAALAAGETPSPEMVAAAPKEGALRPAVAVALLAAALASLALFVALSERILAVNFLPLDKPPEVLADRAASLLKKIGHTAAPADTAYGFSADADYYRYFREKDQSMSRLERLRPGQPAALIFNYRQSPHHLEPQAQSNVSETDPSPFLLSGMASVRLDPTGRLVALHVVPPQIEGASADAGTGAATSAGGDSTGAPDWPSLFAEAGLDIAKFASVESRRTPPVYADGRAAWEGVFPAWPEVPLRVEAASYRGRPVYFELVGPWSRPGREEPERTNAATKRVLTVVLIILAALTAAAVWMARSNLRLGRGDRRGAFRMALFVFLCSFAGRTLGSDHVPTFDGELWIQFLNVAHALFGAALLWLFYVALEPHVRRRTPNRII